MTRLFVMFILVCESAGGIVAAANNVLRIYFQPGRLMGNVTTSQAVQ